MMRMLDENQRKADTRVQAQAAITGATPEQQLASREVNRKTFADSLADMASNASALRDQYLNNYQNQRARTWAQRLGMQDQLASIYANAANQWATGASNAFAAGGNMLGQGLDATLSKKGATPPTITQANIEPAAPVAGAGSTYIAPPPAADAATALNGLNKVKARIQNQGYDGSLGPYSQQYIQNGYLIPG